MLAWGWRRVLIAFLAGAATTLALPPIEFWPAPFVTFPVLVWLVDGSAAGRYGGAIAAALAGWWFGFGYFVCRALLDRQCVPGRCQDVRLAAAVRDRRAAGRSRALHRRSGLRWRGSLWPRGAMRVLALALALTVAEWLRGHLLTGFPWNAFGYALMSPSGWRRARR